MKYRCHSNLTVIKKEGFSPAALRFLTGGNRKFPHRLQLNRADITSAQIKSVEHMSISGVQDKISLKLRKGLLELADHNGQYILKPVPSLVIPKYSEDVPANEHLTMQIASQIFRISTAANACIYLNDDSMAYITRRFDYRNGIKIAQEDFCQLSSRCPDSHGKHYKYSGSYEEMGRIIRRFCKAYIIETEKLFRLISFNYVFSNGDAHMKNFSLHESPYGDYVLTPAYDLICSSLHFPTESRTAVDMFDNYESEAFAENGFYRKEDFMKLAEIYGIQQSRAENILVTYKDRQTKATELINRSFLSEKAKVDYKKRVEDRLRALTYP